MGRDLGFMTRFWMSMTKFFDIMNSFMIAEINKTPWFYQWICDTQIMWKLFYVILLRIIVLSFFTAQKMKFSTIDFFSKCDQIRNGKLRFLCSVWTLNYVDCIHLSCFDSFRMAHKPNNLRKFILEFLKNMIKPPSSCRGSYDCLNNPCLSLHLSVTHFSQDLLSGFS